MEKAIEVRGISYSYKSRYQKVQVLKGISCEFRYGRMYSLTGKSGSGKSTLLSQLAGLDLPDEGDILVQGSSIRGMDRDRYRREQVSVVYQAFHLFQRLTVLENVMFPMRMKRIPKKQAEADAKGLIRKVALPDTVFRRFPGMISGGEQQRVAIARAMAGGGKILLADEPTGNLDSANESGIVSLLRRLAHREGYAVILATHNPQIAQISDAVLTLQDGRLTEVVER